MRVRLFTSVLLVAAACGGSDSSTTGPVSKNQTVDVFTIGNVFSPSFQTVAVGDTVRFNFAAGSDGMGHNVRFTPAVPGAPSDVSVLKSGTVLRVFATKGDYNYVCDVHPGMIGEIVVQ